MVEKIDVRNASEENKQMIKKISKDKAKLFLLPLLCMVLMTLELALYVVLEADMFYLIICTFILSSIIQIYVIYKLNVAQILLSHVLTAISNNMTIKEWAHMDKEQAIKKEVKVVKVSWRSFIPEYIMIFISCFVCVGAPFIAVIDKFI
ncbi:hypothetical protein ACF91D_28580 [Staphylococcus sp. 231237_7MaSpsaltlick]|uniref:hypothetical protein n=1 Tax=Staphylococcus sp. 231237_7MaSpsaltlick TaxID=3367518 RepID=UPI00370A0977